MLTEKQILRVSKSNVSSYKFEVCLPRCLNSITNLIMHYTYSQKTTILPTSNTALYWIELHVSALCIGYHQVVLRLVERLCNKRGILRGGGDGGTISRLCNSGWHNLGLYKMTIKPPFTLNQFTMFKIIIS